MRQLAHDLEAVGACGLCFPNAAARCVFRQIHVKSLSQCAGKSARAAATPPSMTDVLQVVGTCFSGSDIVIHLASAHRCGPSSQRLRPRADESTSPTPVAKSET